MTLFANCYRKFMEEDKEVLIMALELAVESIDIAKDYPGHSVKAVQKLFIDNASESRGEWDLDSDDLGD